MMLNVKINLILVIKLGFFSPKSQVKNLNILRTKTAFKSIEVNKYMYIYIYIFLENEYN